jgi:hypothetical protein
MQCVCQSKIFVLRTELFKKSKSKVHPRTGHEGPKAEYRYTSTLSLSLATGEGGWSTPHPGHFTTGKEIQHPLYRWLGGPQDWSGRVGKNSPPSGFDPQIVQLIASSYTDSVTLAPYRTMNITQVNRSITSLPEMDQIFFCCDPKFVTNRTS